MFLSFLAASRGEGEGEGEGEGCLGWNLQPHLYMD